MARSTDDPRLCFKALYHDELSGLSKEFQVKFYLNDRTVELSDLGTRKVYLRRTEVKNLDSPDFVLGRSVVVFGRLLHLKEYMDAVTSQLCEGVSRGAVSHVSGVPHRTIPVISPLSGDANHHPLPPPSPPCGTCFVFVERSMFFKSIGKVFSVLDVELGFTVTGITAGTLPATAVADFIGQCSASNHFAHRATPDVRYLSGKMVCCFRLAKANCSNLVDEIYRRLTRVHVDIAQRSYPHTSSCGLLAVSTPNSDPDTQLFSSLFDSIQARASLKHQQQGPATNAGTVVIIKPHILVEKLAGDIINVLLEQTEGEVVAMSLVNLSTRDAASLLAPYRGVIPEFHGTMSQLASGPSIALHLCSRTTASVLALEDAYRDKNACAGRQEPQGAGDPSSLGSVHSDGRGDDEEVFIAVRALCGPYDPTIARAIRGSTIRARYGVDRSLNAVHCCDIPDDVSSMCKFIFGVVSSRRVLDPSTEAA